jgi:peroxiredoxin
MFAVSKIFYLFTLFLAGVWTRVDAQSSADSIQLKTVKGKLVSYSSVTSQSPLVLVCFWSVNSDASIAEMNALNTQYAKYKKPSFLLLGICIDEGNLVNRMRPMAQQNSWVFDVYADLDGALQRQLHFTQPPQAFIVRKGEVVYEQSGFSSGSESYLFSKMESLSVHDHL